VLENIPQFVPNETCLSCDGCCRFAEAQSIWRPKVVPEEIEDLGTCSDQVRPQLEQGLIIRAVEQEGQVQCALFQPQENRCGIYGHHPLECRLYPFLLLEREKGLAIGVHLNCPYIQERRQHSDFTEHVKTLKQFLRRKGIRDFLKKNRILAQEYASYQQQIEDLFMLELDQ